MKQLKLRIERSIWLRMFYYAREALPCEVTGVGLLEPEADYDGVIRSLKVTEASIVKQKTSGGYCQFAKGALHDAYLDLIEAGRGDEIEKMRLRWHSHGSGSVFFSITDENDIEDNNLNVDWMVSLIINTNGEAKAAVDFFEPFRVSAPIEVEIYDEVPFEIIEHCRSEVKKKLTHFDAKKSPKFSEKIPAGKGGKPKKAVVSGGKNLPYGPGPVPAVLGGLGSIVDPLGLGVDLGLDGLGGIFSADDARDLEEGLEESNKEILKGGEKND